MWLVADVSWSAPRVQLVGVVQVVAAAGVPWLSMAPEIAKHPAEGTLPAVVAVIVLEEVPVLLPPVMTCGVPPLLSYKSYRTHARLQSVSVPVIVAVNTGAAS